MRKLGSVLAALVCVAGFTIVATGSATASITPSSGSYNGQDHHGATVSFSFNGSTVSHLRIGPHTVGTVPVSNGQLHETCGNGYCVKGNWLNESIVQGYWRMEGTHNWTGFRASVPPTIEPYTGTYRGADHSHLKIHFSYSDGYLRGFTWDHNHFGDAAVDHNGHFSACSNNFCFKGHWQNRHYVFGQWRYQDQDNWKYWDAGPYLS